MPEPRALRRDRDSRQPGPCHPPPQPDPHGSEGIEDVAILAGGTDGGDGPGHDAAGAIALGSTVRAGAEAGRSAVECLAQSDSYGFFRGMEEHKYGGKTNVEHLRDGPTGTNVADLTVLLVGATGTGGSKM